MKIDREKVYRKYGGRCAYCGNEIEYKNMQVDHLVPQHLFDESQNLMGIEMNGFENLMPSCRRCNHYKRAHSLETFRRLLMDMEKKVVGTYLGKIAKDYKMVEWKGWDGIFYFERKEESIIIESIKSSNPDILIVAMGAPYSDKWIYKYKEELLKIKVVFGVGGSLDVLAGKVKVTPEIWKKLNLEWFHRLITVPVAKGQKSRWLRQIAIPKFILQVLFF